MVLLISCQEKNDTKNNYKTELSAKVDNYVAEISKRYNIPGVALAIVKDGQILHQNYYGKANLEHNVKVADSSVFRVYSLTKPIVATAIFQLIKKDKLSLDDEISKHLSDLPYAWQSIKVKNLLRHSSGLPEIRLYDQLPEQEAKEKVYKDSIRFVQDSRIEYNQTNYWLLLRLIEKLSNEEMEGFILTNQFQNVDSEDVFFSTDSRDIHKNRVSLYFPYETGEMQTVNHHRKDFLTSANGLNINMPEFIKWESHFSKGEVISEETKRAMWQAKTYENDSRPWAYGWNEYVLNGHNSYGFSGSMVTVFRHFPEDNLSFIYLTNGFEHWYNIENVVNHLAYIVNEDIIDYKVFAFEELLKTANTNIDNLKSCLSDLKRNPNLIDYSFEKMLNTVGYTFLKNLENTDKAIKVFQLNSEEYPDSGNVYDSLGEAFEKKGDFQKAVENYTKAKGLSDDSKYRSEMDDKIEKLRIN